MTSVYPVILCGGGGTRLWPASGPAKPKQFLALAGETSLLQETGLRLAAIADARPPIVVVAETHQSLAAEQLSATGLACAFVTEPGGRNSAPAIAAAALEVAALDSQGVILAVAADHCIPDAKAFAAGVGFALGAAHNGALVTFGVRPTSPSSAYGYIQPGDAIDAHVRKSLSFVEKPAATVARSLVAAGWLWNSGNFLFRADVVLEELSLRAPGLIEAVSEARAKGARDGAVLNLSETFREAPSVAIDVAVMEKTQNGAVLPVDYAWSDLGAWDSVLAAAERDEAGNAVQAAAVVEQCDGCLIRAPAGARVVALGLRNVAVVVEGDNVLVCDLAAAQSVGGAVARLTPKGRRSTGRTDGG